jgi:hypothetical protein
MVESAQETPGRRFSVLPLEKNRRAAKEWAIFGGPGPKLPETRTGIPEIPVYATIPHEFHIGKYRVRTKAFTFFTPNG